MRWLEWGARSYFDYALDIALLLVAIGVAAARTAEIPQPVAYLMGLSGLTYLAQGWVVGTQGFSGTDPILILLAWVLSVVGMIWLAGVARRHRVDVAKRLGTRMASSHA